MLDRRFAGFAGAVVYTAGTLDAAVGADGDDGHGAADCLCEPGESSAGASHRQTERDCGAAVDWREPWAHCFAVIDGNAFAVGVGRTSGAGPGFLGRQGADEGLPAGGLDGPEYFDAAGFSDSGFYVGRNDCDGHPLWSCAGFADHAAGCGARSEG